MKTSVEINGLRLFARHGVMPQEKTVGNLFEISLSLDYPMEEAMRHDDIAASISYAEVIEIVKDEMLTPSLTLEHVAWRLREALTGRFPLISGGVIRVAKLTPPVTAEIADAAVKIIW